MRTPQQPTSRVSSDIGPFGMVPVWLLLSPVGNLAIRLFALLGGQYADRDLMAFPARSTLGRALRCSVDSVDRAIRELVEAGAVVVEQRRDPNGDRTSNLYQLRLTRPDQAEGVAAPMRPPSRTSAATGSRTHAARVAAPVRHRTIPIGTRPIGTGGEAPTPQKQATLIPPYKAFANVAHFSPLGDVPHQLHSEFVRKVMNGGANEPEAESQVMAFYAAVEQQFAGRVVGERPFKFWSARFEEYAGGAGAGSSDRTIAGMREFLNGTR